MKHKITNQAVLAAAKHLKKTWLWEDWYWISDPPVQGRHLTHGFKELKKAIQIAIQIAMTYDA